MHFSVLVIVPFKKDNTLPAYKSEAERLLHKREARSKWDWYQFGGRWTGKLDPAYDPEKDPANIELCRQCNGTGARSDMAVINEDGSKTFLAGVNWSKQWSEQCNGCNGCQGTGYSIKWPTDWKEFSGDFQPILRIIELKVTTYAIVTPDGKWHEFDDEYWGFKEPTEEEKKMIEEKRVKTLSLYEKYREGYYGLIYDLHN